MSALVDAATEADGVHPLSEDAMLHAVHGAAGVRHLLVLGDGDEPARLRALDPGDGPGPASAEPRRAPRAPPRRRGHAARAPAAGDRRCVGAAGLVARPARGRQGPDRRPRLGRAPRACCACGVRSPTCPRRRCRRASCCARSGPASTTRRGSR
nr:hypothetical protein [Angustibacter aerolatus]